MVLIKKSTAYYTSLSLIFFIFAMRANKELSLPVLQISKQDAATNFHTDFAKIFSLGQKRLLSSLLWSKTLLESDLEHYKTRDLNSWLFLRFKTIITLEPNFYETYLYGGQYLSIIKDDLSGASYIYDEGLRKFPDDYLMNYHAGYHFLYEVKDVQRAKIAYTRLSTLPDIQTRFPLLPKILAKIEDQNSDSSAALVILLKAYNELPADNPLKEAYRRAIEKRGGSVPNSTP